MKKSSIKFICTISLALTSVMTPVMASTTAVSNTPIPKKNIQSEEGIKSPSKPDTKKSTPQNDATKAPSQNENKNSNIIPKNDNKQDNTPVKPPMKPDNKPVPSVPKDNVNSPSKKDGINSPSKTEDKKQESMPQKENSKPPVKAPQVVPAPKQDGQEIKPTPKQDNSNSNLKDKSLLDTKDNKLNDKTPLKDNSLEDKTNDKDNKDLNVPIDKQILVFDHDNSNNLPANFRTSSDSIKGSCDLNLKGLKKLNISGSEQFSQFNLKLIKQKLKRKKNIVFVDLRQESHGFVNGLPVSWEGNGNKANMGLSRNDVIKINNTQLAAIKPNEPIVIGKKSLNVESRFDEQTLVESSCNNYLRITVTDTKLPTPDMIDFFVKSVDSLPKNTHLHFHCKEGIGRTTTFMMMYDMMKNAKHVSLEDIVARQIKLGNLEDKESDLENKDRLILFKDFYEYCKKGDFKKPFSEFAPNYKGN